MEKGVERTEFNAQSITLRAEENMNGLPRCFVLSERPVTELQAAKQSQQPMAKRGRWH